MREENFEDPNGSNESTERIAVVLTTIQPVLVQRLQRSSFADGIRMNGQVEDLAQEACFRFVQHCQKNGIPEDPLAYLIQIAKFAAYEFYRYLKKTPLDPTINLDFLYAGSLGADSETTGGDSDARLELLRIAIEGLPTRQREAVELRNRNEGATDRELGVLMGISEDGFRKQYKRGVERLNLVLKTQIAKDSVRSSTPIN